MDRLTEKDEQGNWHLNGARSGVLMKKPSKEQAKHQWIPVEEQLPESDKYILLSFRILPHR